MSNAVPRDQKKWEMNSDPRSEVTWLGTPCFEKICRMKSCASCCDVIVSYVRIKSDCLERQSTMTRIEVSLEDSGSFSMKSMEMEFHGLLGIGSCLRSPYGLWCTGLAWEQMVHDLQ